MDKQTLNLVQCLEKYASDRGFRAARGEIQKIVNRPPASVHRWMKGVRTPMSTDRFMIMYYLISMGFTCSEIAGAPDEAVTLGLYLFKEGKDRHGVERLLDNMQKSLAVPKFATLAYITNLSGVKSVTAQVKSALADYSRKMTDPSFGHFDAGITTYSADEDLISEIFCNAISLLAITSRRIIETFTIEERQKLVKMTMDKRGSTIFDCLDYLKAILDRESCENLKKKKITHNNQPEREQ